MPGKRLRDPSLTRTTFPEVVANNGEILTDWEVNNPSNQLVWARPIPLKLIGNAWFQGSYDLATWDNYVKDDHNYLRVSTDGGETWRVINLTGGGDNHPPVTIGTPDGGLEINVDTQVLILNPSTSTTPGSMSAPQHIKLAALKFDIFQNVGGGAEIYKDYTDAGDNRTHDIKTLISSDGSVVFTEGTDTIDLVATGAGGGVDNTASNYGTDGVGPYDSKNGIDLRFRNLAVDAADTLGILSITLDATDHDIDFLVDHTVIPHNELDGVVPNEHIDHSTVSILTTEGVQGGGDITISRTVTLAFDELGVQTTLEDSDLFAFYRNESGEDLHYAITYANLKTDLGIPTEVPLYAYDGVQITGNDLLSGDQYISLNINGLPTVSHASGDYVAIYDVSNGNHAKITLLDLIGEFAVSITAGDGMDFTTITSTGPVTLGTPTTLTKTTTDSASGTTHEHEVDLSTWDLQDLGNVDTPTDDQYYLKYNLGTNTWSLGDPSIGASSPGLPDLSIQFNNSNVFAGNSGLLYDYTNDAIYFTDPNASIGSTLFMGVDTTEQYIKSLSNYFIISNFNDIDYTEYVDTRAIILNANRVVAGTDFPEGSFFFGISDTNTPVRTYTMFVVNDTDELLKLKPTGELYLPNLGSGSESNILYYNSTTGEVTYGASSGTGIGQTLVADSLSGLMVNGDSSSAASTIELDQNDNKLDEAIPLITDWIGFWDNSATGIYKQRKVLIGDLPGWLLDINGVGDHEFNPGDTLNIAEGPGINLNYTTGTLTISSDGSSGGGCTQLVDDLGTITDGNTAYFDLDIYSGAIITVDTEADITLQFDNLEEGDTGHVEISHSGSGSVTITAPDALDIRIANNSKDTGDKILISSVPTMDILVYWFAKGNLHLAVVYDSK